MSWSWCLGHCLVVAASIGVGFGAGEIAAIYGERGPADDEP